MDVNYIKEASAFIEKHIDNKPAIGLVLGSGLGVLAEEIQDPVMINYEDIPHFPTSTVAGHKGRLVIGTLQGKHVVAMQGRFHYYEGYTMQQVTFPIRVMKELGIHSLIVTNAAGGINKAFIPGDLMIITDHINNMGTNPLVGPNDDRLGPRFPDLSRAYDHQYIKIAKQCAETIGLNIKEGVYVANQGPIYETPIEVNMLRTLGGDAVGMSTVPEVIVANHASLRVLGISCISNMAAGILDQPLTHDEVIETTERVKEDFLKFVKETIKQLPNK
ncbi:MAG TPA: purine-nucleoside phosphorylase [Cerasibacillus sp.]|uniref:purine-nucleoside phosphorylase n=1 Tax=Cerasibacillus sp. TaxID=2498711 RepID=UPI002F3E5DF5